MIIVSGDMFRIFKFVPVEGKEELSLVGEIECPYQKRCIIGINWISKLDIFVSHAHGNNHMNLYKLEKLDESSDKIGIENVNQLKKSKTLIENTEFDEN